MVKQRFTTLDVSAMTEELQATLLPQNLSPYRVQNIYQLSPKAFVFKLARSENVSGLDQSLHPLKCLLLMESGVRFHPTVYENFPKSTNNPSPLLLKMRKYIKGKRLCTIEQLGEDRVVKFVFGAGKEYEFRLYLELYSSGNIIITDFSDKILALLRIVNTERLCLRVDTVYEYPPFSSALINENELSSLLKATGNPKKLATLHPCFKGSKILAQEALHMFSENQADIKLILDFINLKKHFKGFIIQSDTQTFQDFSPVIDSMAANYVEYPHFGAAVDTFYSSLESQLFIAKQAQLKSNAEQRKQSIRASLASRINELVNYENDCLEKAQAIEQNIDLVSSALWVILSSLASGMAWDEIEVLVKKEQEKGNNVALAIQSLDFGRNTIQVLCPSSCSVSLNLSLTAQGNIQWYYDERRATILKREKTIEAQNKALLSAEKKIDSDLKEALSKLPGPGHNLPMRKILWFEKFSWFISSDQILVIAGANAQQNELLVKKYLGPLDIYVHAELQGAPSVIIKCPEEITMKWIPPPATLSQACSMAVCLSPAWSCNVVTGAYWVYANQVSKTPPAGLYLSSGSFMIYGKKNFVAPSPLVYGFGFLFKLGDSSSIDRHRITRANIHIEDTSEESKRYENALEDEFIKKEEERIAQASCLVEEALLKKSTHQKQQKKSTQKKADLQKKKPDDTSKSSKEYKDAKPTPSVHIAHKKQGKLKKLKNKYKDQDFEETVARLQLLGVQDAEKHAQKRFNHVPDEIISEDSCVQGISAEQQDKVDHAGAEDIPAIIPPISANQEEIFSKTDEEDQTSDEDTEDLSANISPITPLVESFTGCPVAEDTLINCIPMCGPWGAFQNFSYKVKLSPGNLKKGKAVKTAVSLCLMQLSQDPDKEFSKRVSALLKAVKDEQMINVMIQNCKLSGPSQALQKIQQTKKKIAKGKAKQKSK